MLERHLVAAEVPDAKPLENWIYVHSPDVRKARISDYRNFPVEMTSAPDIHALALEYIWFADDDIWTGSDEKLTALAVSELQRMGISHGALLGSFIVRSAKT